MCNTHVVSKNKHVSARDSLDGMETLASNSLFKHDDNILTKILKWGPLGHMTELVIVDKNWGTSHYFSHLSPVTGFMSCL